jgi:hypothetical protein
MTQINLDMQEKTLTDTFIIREFLKRRSFFIKNKDPSFLKGWVSCEKLFITILCKGKR